MFFKRNKELRKRVADLEYRVDVLLKTVRESEEKNQVTIGGKWGGYGKGIPLKKAIELLAEKAGVEFEWVPSDGPKYKLREKDGNTR